MPPEEEPAPQPEVGAEDPAATAQEDAESFQAREQAMSYEEMAGVDHAPAPEPAQHGDSEVREVLENGIRDISGEVRNSLDFHRSQDGGGEVTHVVLSGAAQDIPGFATALELSLGVPVRGGGVGLVDERLAETVSKHRLAVAAGLATTEAPQ